MSSTRTLHPLVLTLATFSGCTRPHATQPRTQRDDPQVLQVWPRPADKWRSRADGEGPYPPSWPTAAILCQNRVESDASTVLYDATLFLLAGPELDLSTPISAIPKHAKYACRCRAGDARGHWLPLARESADFFLLVSECGGTAGLQIEAFAQRVDYADHTREDAYQCHSFSQFFVGNSRIPPYMADVDHDGAIELIIGSDVTNSSGAPDTPQIYWIMKWHPEHRDFRRIEEIPADRLASRVQGLAPL